ncbi:MAG: holo-ACP synthase [Armatimonadetes bacterium]|nr:holo-ACP synthase [Armatimonadota bacterium]
MIDGVGIDIIEVARIARAVRNPRFVRRVFTEREAHYCRAASRGERFAGRFAAKEAVMKALGRAFPWREIEVLSLDVGQPYGVLSGRAAAALGGRRLLLSISHCTAYAVAQAIIFSDGPGSAFLTVAQS